MADGATWPKMMRCSLAHPQVSVTGCKHIHCLCDELLMEILLRLDKCKSVFRSKCVCKRWAALVSHHGFSVNFICRNLNKEQESFAFVMWYRPDNYRHLLQEFELEGFFRPSIFQAQDSSFSPLVRCLGDGDDNDDAIVVASCRDLLLYRRHENDKYKFYMSNVQTREWVMLPSPPFYCHKNSYYLTGFICTPFSSSSTTITSASSGSGSGRNGNVACHYSVVVVRCITKPKTRIPVHLFSSHCDSQWRDKVLCLPETCVLCDPTSCISFCFDEKLHLSCFQGFFGFDHNASSIELDENDEIECHFVRWPVGMLQGNHRVGVSQGRVHLSAINSCRSALNVWVLQDYEAGVWMLKHRVEYGDWVPRRRWIRKELKRFSGFIRLLGFHPNNSDVIYVVVPGCIFLCDLPSKTMKLACRIPVAVAKTCEHYLRKIYGVPLTFQSWPTRLPPLA